MEFFGLDIGSSLIKAVQLVKKADKYQLVAFGSALSTQKGLLSESEADFNNLALVIKKLHQEAKIKTNNVAATLPQDQITVRLITTPKLTDEELESALKWEAEQYVPFPLDEAAIEHQIVGQTEDKGQVKMEVLLVVSPNRLIDKTMKVLKAAGLNPVSLEPEITAIARSLVSPNSGRAMIVDLGAKATDLAVVESGLVVFTNSIPTAGEAITRAVALDLSLEPDQAEAYKKAYGMDTTKLEGKVTKAIDPVLAVISSQMEKTIQFFQSKNKNIERIILTGGTAGLPEISGWMAKKINLEIQIGNPFTLVVDDGLVSKMNAADRTMYAGAVGLALKQIN